MFSNLIYKAVSAALAMLLLDVPSHAQTVGIDIRSDIGTYQPVALGEDITLSACGSNIVTGGGAFISSICDTNSPNFFSINYLISYENTTSALTFGTGGTGVTDSIATLTANRGGTTQSLGNTAAGLGSFAISTGAGSLFSTAGTYVISLITAVTDRITIPIANGPNQRTFADGGLVLSNTGFDINGVSVGNFDNVTVGTLGRNPSVGNGFRNVGFSQTTIVIEEAASVPEPSNMLMLLFVLLAISYLHRRNHIHSFRFKGKAPL